MRTPRVTRLVLPLFFLLAALATYLVRHHVFFWDTVQLGSKHAHFYYENHFATLLLPEELDSGHPPTFGLYLAMLWTLFGKTLPVSHFAMLPFVLGILYFLYRIGTLVADRRFVVFLLLLAVADPTLAAQCVLISPDVPLVCFFLMAVFAILQQHYFLKLLAMLGLSLVSMRGMMTIAALFTFDSLIHLQDVKKLPKLLLQQIPAYLPAGLFGLAFLIGHYTQTGWIGYHSNSPWAPSFARVDARGFTRNVIVLIWRLLDFGRIFVWLACLLVLLRLQPLRRLWQITPVKHSLLLLGSCLLLLTPTLLLYQGLSAHRYLLPIYLALSLLTYALIFTTISSKKMIGRYVIIVIIGLASGNSWIYPTKIAQGWDATLAHLQYYAVRTAMLQYIDRQQIALDSIGTAYPEIGPQKFRDLSGRETGFAEKNFTTQSYILYSNVMNDFTDQEEDTLQQHWTPVQTFARGGVRMVLYEKPEASQHETFR